MNEKQKKILKEFEDQRSVYEAFTEYCENELRQFIKENDLEHLLDRVSARTKQILSFKRKLLEDPILGKLEKHRDLSGIRAIFYADAAISTFFNRISFNCRIRSLECTEIKKVYRIPHFLNQFVVLKISEEALMISPHLKQFKGLLCELQVRDTLQNAWAPGYHQTIYKNRKYFRRI